MPHDVLQSLEALISQHADGGPTPLGWRIQVELAQALLRHAELARAAEVLDSVSDDGPDQRRELASVWLKLARARATQPATDQPAQVVPAQHEHAAADSPERAATDPHQLAEAALQRAAQLDPATGWPALAQHLQRQQRWEDAAEAWRQAISARPTEPSAYLSLGRVYERLGQPEQALATYIALVEALPTARSYLTVAPRLQELAPRLPAAPSSRQLRIALLGNATLDHLASYVTVECFRAGLRPQLYQGPFDQTTQEI